MKKNTLDEKQYLTKSFKNNFKIDDFIKISSSKAVVIEEYIDFVKEARKKIKQD